MTNFNTNVQGRDRPRCVFNACLDCVALFVMSLMHVLGLKLLCDVINACSGAEFGCYLQEAAEDASKFLDAARRRVRKGEREL